RRVLPSFPTRRSSDLTVFLLVTLFIGTSQGFGLVALLTSGGPGDSTTVLPYYMYQTGFQFYRFGYAAAIGLVTFVGVLLLTLARSEEHTSELQSRFDL